MEWHGKAGRTEPVNGSHRIKGLNAVRIIHNILNRTNYVFLAEFFRMLGVFVWEDILPGDGEETAEERKKTEAEKKTVCDVNIFVGAEHLSGQGAERMGCTGEAYEEMIGRLPEDVIFFYDRLPTVPGIERDTPGWVGLYLDEEAQIRLLLDVVEEAACRAAGNGTAAFRTEELEELTRIYVEERLCLHSINLQYFTRRKSFAVQEARVAMLAGYRRLEGLGTEEYGQDVRASYRYALLWCAVRANGACSYLEEETAFSVRELAGRCQNLCTDHPEFTNAKVLQGLCYEPSKSSANEALYAFEEALRDVGDSCFASAIYYWMGKRYEAFQNNKKEMKLCFREANERQEKFRNLFKLAIIARDEGRLEDALDIFEKIDSKLLRKLKMSLLDPLELEYLFKSYNQQCYLYYQMEEYGRAIEFGKKAVRVKEEYSKPGWGYAPDLYQALYGEDGDTQYRQMTDGRMNLSASYQLLADSYRKMLNEEEADKYIEKRKEAERG